MSAEPDLRWKARLQPGGKGSRVGLKYGVGSAHWPVSPAQVLTSGKGTRCSSEKNGKPRIMNELKKGGHQTEDACFTHANASLRPTPLGASWLAVLSFSLESTVSMISEMESSRLPLTFLGHVIQSTRPIIPAS